MKEDQHIKNLLQEQFAQYEAEPNRNLWPAIEAEMKQSRRRGLPLWTRYLAVAASLLLLMGLIWLLRQPQQLPQAPLAEQSQPQAPAPSQRDEVAPPTIQPQTEEAPEPNVAEQPAPTGRSTPAVAPSRLQPENQTLAQPQLASEEPTPEPRRITQPRLRPESMTPIHHQLAINQSLSPKPDPESTTATPVAVRTRKTQKQPADPSGKNRALNLNNLTLASAVSFASDELNRWAKSPVEIYEEETPEREVKTYELDILNLRITRKIHKKTK